MADNVEPFKNVEVLECGQDQLAINQIGIQLVKETKNPVDPVVEVAVVTRRASGLMETEFCLLRNDSLAKMAEHLTLRSNFESARDNELRMYEDKQHE